MAERQLGFREERRHLDQYIDEINAKRHPLSLLLDGVSNRRNLGSLFRLADAARLAGIYGYRMHTDTKEHKIVEKVARSTHQYVSYRNLNSWEEVTALKEQAPFIGLEITTTSIPFYQLESLPACTLIIGHEKHGISKELLELTDQCIHIPMFGINTSMNVSMATGIAVYGLLEKLGAW